MATMQISLNQIIAKQSAQRKMLKKALEQPDTQVEETQHDLPIPLKTQEDMDNAEFKVKDPKVAATMVCHLIFCNPNTLILLVSSTVCPLLGEGRLVNLLTG